MSEEKSKMNDQNTISVIIAALNEQRNLEATVRTVRSVASDYFDDVELLIIDDGSRDKTGEIADALAEKLPGVRAFHNASPRCIGGVFKQGAALSRMNYLVLVNGKNDKTEEGLRLIFSNRGKADVVIPYITNMNERSWQRRFLSKAFTAILNTTFGHRLKYYNDSVLHTKSKLDEISIRTDSYAFQAEALIKLLAKGASYLEVGMDDRYEKGISTKAFKLQNLTGVAKFYFGVIRDVYFADLKG